MKNEELRMRDFRQSFLNKKRLKKTLFLFLFCSFLMSCGNNQPQVPVNKLPPDYAKENMLEINRVLTEKENADIKAYIDSSDVAFSKHQGFWYNIEEQGEGAQIQRGMKVHIRYTLSLLDGIACYTPENGGDVIITIGKYDIIKGLDDALLLLNEDGKGTFIIPSDLAFGMIGDQHCVGAKKTIIYKIESVKIIP